MHEWAVAESIVLATLKEAERVGMKSISKVKIKVGELHRMEKDILSFAIISLFREHGYEIKEDGVLISEEETEYRCKNCGISWKYKEVLGNLEEDEREFIHFIPEVSASFMRCPSCGSFDFDFERGRGILLEAIEGEV